MKDLSKYLTDTIDFKLGERVFKCAPISRMQFEEMYGKEDETKGDTRAFYAWMSEFVFKILKKANDELTQEEYEQYPQRVITSIYNMMAKTAYEVISNPN